MNKEEYENMEKHYARTNKILIVQVVIAICIVLWIVTKLKH